MKKLRIATAALALGAITFVAAPAFSQQRSPNDGGPVSLPSGAKLDGGSKASASTSSYVGRSANDGGPGPQPTAAQLSASSSQGRVVQKPAGSNAGRPANDGGLVQ